MQKRFRHALTCSLLFFSLAATAQAAVNVYEYRLNNGLQLLVKPDHRSPVVFSSIWYKVGGSYEQNGTTGVSHVLEHMMFRGTKRFGPGVLDKMISEVGGQQNAMTSNDFTMYYQVLPANRLSLSFMVEADRMQNLLLTQEDFKKEIQVVMEERRMRFEDNPEALAWERFLASAYINNPYHHQTIGWMTDLQNMTDSNVRQWYQKWYHPNNAVIVVVGDVYPKKVNALAQKYFGNIKKQTVPRLKPRLEVRPLGKIKTDISLPAKLPLLIMGYQTPTLTTTKEKWQPYAIDVLANILGGSGSSRLQNRVVRQKRIASSISVDYDPFNLHSNLMQIFAVPTPAHTLVLLEQAIKVQLKDLQIKQITQAELNRIKAQIIASKVYARDSLQQQGMVLGIPMVVGLSWQAGENYYKAISQITPSQVQQVAKQIFVEKALTVATLLPQTPHDNKGQGDAKTN